MLSKFSNCVCCYIRISMNNLKDIHNHHWTLQYQSYVVILGFQWTIWRIYTTRSANITLNHVLFCQDFNEQFEGYTQPRKPSMYNTRCCFIRMSMNNSAAKVQKILEICKFIRKYFDTSEKSSTFAPTILKDIHNKDYSVV